MIRSTVHNEEYRGYIGYTDGGKKYLGLQANSSITIDVPLVFWDSGTGGHRDGPRRPVAGGSEHEPEQPDHEPILLLLQEPGQLEHGAVVVDAAKSTDGNGIVMFYHAGEPPPAVNPAP